MLMAKTTGKKLAVDNAQFYKLTDFTATVSARFNGRE
jgi:hypothetical protein